MTELQMKPEHTLRERLLEWCFAELNAGVKAPARPAKNISPRIKQYLAGCRRHGSNGVGRFLAKTGGNWCAASQGMALNEVALDDDIRPHQWRAGVVEMQADAIDSGHWVPAKAWLAGDDTRPLPGDLALWHRPGGEPWWGHVNRVTQIDGFTFSTIGGNEYRAWRLKDQTRNRIAERLRGFVLHPETTGRHPLTKTEQNELRAQIDSFGAFIQSDLSI